MINGPWSSINPASAAARDQARAAAQVRHPAAVRPAPTIGPWTLTTAENGDLIALHVNGTVRVLAPTPDQEER